MTKPSTLSPAPPAPLLELVLPVEGMTCATCVNRIERFLNRADGVTEATVNLASEEAAVRYDPSRIDRAGIVEAIESPGHAFAVGVQWHPEYMVGTVPAHLGIYRMFIQRARESRR